MTDNQADVLHLPLRSLLIFVDETGNEGTGHVDVRLRQRGTDRTSVASRSNDLSKIAWRMLANSSA